MVQPKIQTITVAMALAAARYTRTKTEIWKRWGIDNPELLSDEFLKNPAS